MNKEGKYKHGFTTPKSYFKDFDERLFDGIKNGEIEGTTPTLLEDLPAQPGFKTPDGYFDSLEERIIAAATSEDKVKVLPLYRRKAFLYTASIAACLALVFSFFANRFASEETLQVADIEAYFNNDGIDYDTFDIAQLFTESELDNLTLTEALFTEETLEDYLLEHLDDTTLLTE